MLQVLTKNGMVLKGTDGIIVKVPPHWKQWNYLQAVADGTDDIYEWFYKCYDEGFSVASRIINGTTYTVDGGDASITIDGVTYFAGFRWLVIPIIHFNISNTSANRTLFLQRHPWRVLADNPLLLQATFVPTQSQGSAFTTKNGKLETVKFRAPTEAMRKAALEAIPAGVAAVKAAVKLHTAAKYGGGGLTPKTVDTPQKKRDVAKIIHDWLMSNANYGSIDDFWSHSAYSAIALNSPNPPVCDGWARAFAYLCQLFGINALYVNGTAGTGSNPAHAWNYVSFELPIGTYTADAGKWSPVDVTWDDTPDMYRYHADRTYEAETQDHRVRVIVQDNVPTQGACNIYKCIVPVTSPEPFDPEKWEALTTDGRYGLWRYFCTATVYNETNPYKPRANSTSLVFPVAEPTDYHPFYGETGNPDALFGIDEDDWTPPASETQGGGVA